MFNSRETSVYILKRHSTATVAPRSPPIYEMTSSNLSTFLLYNKTLGDLAKTTLAKALFKPIEYEKTEALSSTI